jgi:ribosomal protein L37AE/L43A
MVGSINISTYLKRQKEPLVECIFKSFKAEGIESLNELFIEEEFTTNSTRLNNIQVIKKRFPINLLNIGCNYSEELNSKLGDLTHFYVGENIYVPVSEISVKSLQNILKVAMKKSKMVDYNKKLGINFDKNSIMEVRRSVSNVKLRNVFYRLINKDFFTRERMVKFKMIVDNNCERCGGFEVEDVKHLLWECRETRKMWESLNTILAEIGLNKFIIKEYKDIYSFNENGAFNTIKLRLINELIQINRPINMNVEKVKKIINNLRKTEKYISQKNKKEVKYGSRWKYWENIK